MSYGADERAGPDTGCACTNGYVHYACGSSYIRAKPESSKLVCEVCLADMTNMEVRFQARKVVTALHLMKFRVCMRSVASFTFISYQQRQKPLTHVVFSTTAICQS